MKKRKLLEKVLAGGRNLRFDDFVALVEAFGFRRDRCEGSRHIFKRKDIGKRINIQSCNGKAKPYKSDNSFNLWNRTIWCLEDDE